MALLTVGLAFATGHPTRHIHEATQSQGGTLWRVQITGAIGMTTMGLVCLVILRKTLQHKLNPAHAACKTLLSLWENNLQLQFYPNP